jgi:hypothetical protein
MFCVCQGVQVHWPATETVAHSSRHSQCEDLAYLRQSGGRCGGACADRASPHRPPGRLALLGTILQQQVGSSEVNLAALHSPPTTDASASFLNGSTRDYHLRNEVLMLCPNPRSHGIGSLTQDALSAWLVCEWD